MKEIEDTSKRTPAHHLLGALEETAKGNDPSAYITSMEADGQRQLVESSELPIDTHETDDKFVALGFTFGEPTDDLFRHATLPEGWEKRGTSHPMHSVIVDKRGIERVSIFYKAAFYDRRADMSITNVGDRVVGAFLYGYGEAEERKAIPWELLTEDETAEALKSLKKTVEDGETHPRIYANQAALAKAELERIEVPS